MFMYVNDNILWVGFLLTWYYDRCSHSLISRRGDEANTYLLDGLLEHYVATLLYIGFIGLHKQCYNNNITNIIAVL